MKNKARILSPEIEKNENSDKITLKVESGFVVNISISNFTHISTDLSVFACLALLVM